MSTNHQGGNLQPTLDHEEHQGEINAKRVSLVSAATVYAVVNTSGGNVTTTMPGGVTVFQGTSPWVSSVQGNLTLSDSKTFIGLTTSTLGASPAFIGIATIANPSNVGNVTLNASPNSIGNVTLNASSQYIGLATVDIGKMSNVTLNASANFIGLATVTVGNPANTGNVTLNASPNSIGNVTLNASNQFIGLTTTTLGASPAFIGLATVNIGSSNSVAVAGNLTLSDSKGFIGLTTVTIGGGNLPSAATLYAVVNTAAQSQGMLTIFPGPNFIGLATVVIGSGNLASAATLYAVVNTAAAGQASVALDASVAKIGFATVNVAAGAAYMGLATVDIGTNNSVAVKGNVTLSDAKTFIGLTTTTLGASPAFIGNVTAWDLNAGTTKTLIPLPLAMSTSSVVTIVVPTGGNAIFKMTKVLLNSNATVRLSIKSGVTYLTGNASLGINLNPGGGWVEGGAPDSPIYFGLASGAAIVLEKADSAGVISQIGGSLVYFAE